MCWWGKYRQHADEYDGCMRAGGLSAGSIPAIRKCVSEKRVMYGIPVKPCMKLKNGAFRYQIGREAGGREQVKVLTRMHACVAQMAERSIRNRQVTGSNPAAGFCKGRHSVK